MASNFYERLLERDSRVIALECDDPDAVLGQFRIASRRSGRSIYHWTEEGGLQSLKVGDISVPGTRPFVEALRYVVQSMHYGVYLFSSFERQMSSTPMNYLIQLATEPQADERKVVLISNSMKIPRPLERVADNVSESESFKLTMRLRDGRWILT
jgi:hypothetical protein